MRVAARIKIFYLIILSLPLFSDAWHCAIKTLEDILKQNTQIRLQLFSDNRPFLYKPLPLANEHYLHPFSGIFKQTFILTIPQGTVYGLDGWVLVDDCLVNELIWQNVYLHQDMLSAAKKNPLVEKKGRVAVISQTGYSYYYHWVAEVLGRLAMLEMAGIEYDYLYVPNTAAYMLETLQLWGIDPSKLIIASDDYIIKAEELIVPSLVSAVLVNGCPRLVHYVPPYIAHYIRTKLLENLEKQKSDYQFSKRVFISRQDAGARKILNEDDIFALLEPHGFKRYQLTKLSIIEQLHLFNKAEIIMGTLGSGLTNLLFCNTDTRIIELYQARRDCTIWNLSQMAGIKNHHCVKTGEFIDAREGQYDTEIPLDVICQTIQMFII